MPAQVTIASGVFNLVLPDGNRYQATQVATLTDEQLGQIDTADATAWFSVVTKYAPGAETIADPDAGLLDSATAIVNAAGASVIGGVIGTAWNGVTVAADPAYARDLQAECQTGTNGGAKGNGTFATNLVDTTYTTPVLLAENP